MASDIEALCGFIREEIGYDGALAVDMDLLQAQVLDSFNIVQLAMFVQQRFEVELEAEDLVRAICRRCPPLQHWWIANVPRRHDRRHPSSNRRLAWCSEVVATLVRHDRRRRGWILLE